MNARAQDLEEDIDDLNTPEDDEDELEIEIVDDVSENDKPRLEKPVEVEEPDEEELETYSAKVQARIKKLTFDAKEATRQREQLAREREELAKYAQSVRAQNDQLQQQLRQGRGAYMDQATERVKAQLERAKRAYKEAYESGDADAVLEAQGELTRIQTEQYNLENYTKRAKQEQDRPQAQQPAPQAPASRPQTPELDDRQRTWLGKNDWYGKNRRMTAYALGVHEDLVQEGVDPNSDTYYNKIDAAMRERFVEEFPSEETEVTTPRKKAQNVVASAARTAKSPRRIKLTSTQVALAKRLGISPQQYAEQMLKEQNDG